MPRRRGARAGGVVLAVVVAALTAFAAPASAEQPQQDWKERLALEFEAAVSLPSAPDDTCLSVYLNDEEIVAVDDGAALVPASLNKIATAAAAFEVIGADAVYTTEVFVRSDDLASAEGGTLRGDLYIVGSGDPVLNTPRYVGRLRDPSPFTDVTELGDRVFASLAERGITRIEGRIIGDESRYPDRERDYSQHYPDGAGAAVWKSSFTTENLVGPLSALLLNDGYSSYSTSLGRAARLLRVRAADPAQHAASVFDDLLEAHKMVITNRPRSGAAPEAGERTSLGSVESPPVSEIVRRMMTISDNTIAEMLLKEIGHRTLGSARAQAAAGAQSVLRPLLGARAQELEVSDGSGLSSHNRASCGVLARLLVRAGAYSPLVQGLAVAGERGTVRNCKASALPAGTGRNNRVMAKSGQLNDVVSLAGVAVADNGDEVTFAMIANETLIISLGYCNSLQRTLIDAAAHYTYGPEDGTAAPPPAPSFLDTGGSVHEAEIAAAAAAGITRGCDEQGARFCPDGVVTRAQMAAFLARGLGLAEAPVGRFADTAGSVHEAEIAAAAAAGITRGCDEQGARFCPDGVVTRAQMAAFLARALDLSGGSAGRFADTAGGVHEAAIAAVAAAGVTRGCDAPGTRFCPDDVVTRAQMAAFLARALRL